MADPIGDSTGRTDVQGGRRPRHGARRPYRVEFSLTGEEFELLEAAALVRRIGVNLNQAVARLNATGQRSGDLLPYAAESMRRAERLDAVADEVRKALR